MIIGGTFIEETFAEAFGMWGTRLIVTASSPYWAYQAGLAACGFATSVIGCGCESGIEGVIKGEESPDGRPGVSLLFFGGWNDLEKQITLRVGQTIMTCPGTACYCGLEESSDRLPLGDKLRYFGDGWQMSKQLGKSRYWRIPVMDGEFLVASQVYLRRAVLGGNFLILADGEKSALEAAERAAAVIRAQRRVIAPFPGGVVRSGSKVGSRYRNLGASTNSPYCPTLRPLVRSSLPEGVNSVLEIVIDGLDETDVALAMRQGITAACGPGVLAISAGNYGGKLGKFNFYLREILSDGRDA